MTTKAMRIPEAVHEQVTAASRLLGRSPAQLLEQAWEIYRHSPQFTDDFETARKAFESGDLEHVAERLSQSSRERARRRAARAREILSAE